MLDRLNRVALAVASVGILVMTVLGGLDVVGATFFKQPIPGAYEATEALMAVVVFLAVSSLQARGMNIVVDVFSSRLQPARQRKLLLLANVLGLAFFGLMAWQAWLMAWESFRVLEYMQGAVPVPVYPSKFAFALGVSLLVAQYVKDLIGMRRT